MLEKWALLGIHDDSSKCGIAASLERVDFMVYATSSSADLIAQSQDSKYSFVFMDVNFGSPGSFDLSPLRRVYSVLQERVSNSAVCLVAFTGNEDLIKKAQKERLPIIDKNDFRINDYLK